jgi:hypothetical protein
MLCSNNAKAHRLRLCAADDARLYIGQADCTDIVVTFTNLATGRITEIDADIDGSDYFIDPSLLDPIEYHTYLVQVQHGCIPIKITPYVMDECDIVPSANDYDGVLVEFVKADAPTTLYYTCTDQWLTLVA